MALRAGAGFALQAARSVRGQSLLTRAAGALPPKSCGEYGLSASTIRRFFSSRRDTDSLLRDNIRHAVSKGLKEVLATADSEGKSILKLSVIKSGVNAAVKDSVKGYSVVIDYAEHNVDPAVKLAIEEAVVQGLNKFANQLYNAPLKGEIMGPYLLKLALKEGITEALQCIHKKFVLFVGDGIDRLMIELSLIRALTKPNGKANVNEDFVQVWFCGLVHKFVNNEVIWYVDKAWVMIPYVAGTYLSLLFGITLIESKIPPWEYHKVLNCYRVHGLESALKFYKEKKEKAEEEAAAKKKAEEEEAAAKAEEAAAKKKAEEEEEVAAKKKTEEAAAKKKAEEAAAKKKAEEAAPKKKAEEAAPKKKAEEAAAKKKAEESAGSGEK